MCPRVSYRPCRGETKYIVLILCEAFIRLTLRKHKWIKNVFDVTFFPPIFTQTEPFPMTHGSECCPELKRWHQADDDLVRRAGETVNAYFCQHATT